jgi:hypothetical protein
VRAIPRSFAQLYLRRFIGALGVAVILAACADLPMEPGLPPESRAEPAPGLDGSIRGGQVFVCVTRLARSSEPSSWSHAESGVTFPAAELDPQGRTIEYRYRGYTPSNRIVAAVDCVIPATDAAVERMNRKLKVTRWHRVGSESPRSGARLSVGSASFDLNTEDTSISLAPVTGTAQWCGTGYIGTYPNCYPISSGTPSQPDPDSDGEWTWWEGAGTGTEPDDGTDRPACERDGGGHCKTREISPNEWDRLLARIAAIKEHTDYCLGAKQALAALAQQGREAQRLRFWDGYDMPSSKEQLFGQNLSDAEGRYIKYDSYWIWNMPELLAHEGIHTWMNERAVAGNPVTIPAGMKVETWVRSVDQNCV